MKTTFSFNRLGLLLKRFFIENKQREIIFWSILTLIFILIHNSESVKMILYISGFIFAARQFGVFSNTPDGMHYLLLPATHTEKLTASILLSTVYFFTITIIAYCIGNLIGTSLYNLIFDASLPINWDLFTDHQLINKGESSFATLVRSFLIIQAIFMLGSLYFKRNAVGKTWLSLFAFGSILGLFQLLLLNILWVDLQTAGNSISSYMVLNQEYLNTTFGTIGSIISYSIIPFLWMVSYFRLTEKQV